MGWPTSVGCIEGWSAEIGLIEWWLTQLPGREKVYKSLLHQGWLLYQGWSAELYHIDRGLEMFACIARTDYSMDSGIPEDILYYLVFCLWEY